MFGAIFDFFLTWLAIFFTGIVIKLMDDYLDQELDKIEGNYTFAMAFDKAVLPYCLICMMICMALKPNLTGSLFLSSYIIGMGHHLKQILPLGWSAKREAILFGLLGILIFGMVEMIGSFFIIVFIQLLDDFLDYYTDISFSRRNFIVKFGFWESLMICLITLIGAFLINWQKALLVCISLPIILRIMERGERSWEHA